jgi:hypothetical protein
VERPSDEETLKLVLAFLCIMEPEKRAELRALVEKYAAESRGVVPSVEPTNTTKKPPPR